MPYITELLSAESKVPNAHRHELAMRHSVGNRYPLSPKDAIRDSDADRGCGKHVTHAVVNTDAHPLHRIVCYADRADAERIAAALNQHGSVVTRDDVAATI